MTTTTAPPSRRPAQSPVAGSIGMPRALPKIGRIAALTGDTTARIVLNAVEGWGKTSLGANAPDPVILMAKGETGYATLRHAGRVPDCDAVELETWADAIGTIDSLKAGQHKTIVLDALGGFERLCHEHVCNTQFNGDFGEKGFGSFQKGYELSLVEWLRLLHALDQVRQVRPVNVVILSHSKIRSFKNPMGPDFDRYIADCHEKTWGVTHKWSDAVLFGTFVTVTQEDRKTKKIKGIGGTERVAFTERTDAYDAKNRFGMPQQLDIPDDPAGAWPIVYGAICGTKQVVEDAPPV